MVIYAQTHNGSFEAAAQLDNISVPCPRIAPVDAFPFLVASGNHISAASEFCNADSLRQPSQAGDVAKGRTLVQALQMLGGTRPIWHPEVLQLLLASGRLAEVANLLRSLLAMLQKVGIF